MHASMANGPSSTSDNTTSSSSSADSYIGSLISVTSKSEIRYEGVLYFLNPQDSTLGLKDVRSYGTEGRKNGQQVPPGDKVYEYILFRGSDIKDLQVKTSPPPQTEEAIYNDPAIITSNYCVAPSSSSKSESTGGSLTEFNLYSEPSASNAKPYPNILPSDHSGTQLGIWGSSQSTPNAASSYGMPTQWQAYSAAPGSTAGAQQHSFPSDTMFYPLQNQASTAMEMTHLSSTVSPGNSLAISSSRSFNAAPALSSEKLFMPFTDSLSSKTSLPFHHPTLINSNGLAMPFSITYPNASSIDNQVVNNVIPDPVSSNPVQSFPYTASSVLNPISDSLSRQQQALLTPNSSQPKLFEHSPEKKLTPDPKDMGVMTSISLNSPAVQPPLLPLPPPSQKLQSPVQFTEEFDFQAMNEKFNKDEVWGYLGKANQREKLEVVHENGSSSHDSGEDNPDLESKSDPKPAYNKDDFFDTISCNSVGRGSKNGQNRYSERVKLDTETFGNFQRRPQSGFGGHRGGRGGQYRNWGRGWYNYGNRGRGGYTQR